MEEKQNAVEEGFNWDFAGKGLAFLGVVLFFAFAFLFCLSIALPELFSLFSGPAHITAVSIVSLALVIGGYALTKIGKKQKENLNTNN
jgi:membrane protein implicated in regulation of membrane protease activity